MAEKCDALDHPHHQRILICIRSAKQTLQPLHLFVELMHACEPCVALNLEMKSQVSGGACSDVRRLCTLLSLARARVGCGDGALSVALCYCVVMNSTHDVEGILLIRGVVWRGGGEGMNGSGGDHKEEEEKGREGGEQRRHGVVEV